MMQACGVLGFNKREFCPMAQHVSAPDDHPIMVEMPFEVHTYDIDYFQHVNNQVYVRWLEDLRLRFLDVFLPLSVLLERGIAPIITSTEIHYKRSILLFDKPVGRLWTADLGRAVFTLGAEFRVEGQVACWAQQRGIFADLKSMKIQRVPEELRARYEGMVKG